MLGSEQTFAVPPLLTSGIAMAPINDILENAEMQVEWYAKTRTVFVFVGETRLKNPRVED